MVYYMRYLPSAPALRHIPRNVAFCAEKPAQAECVPAQEVYLPTNPLNRSGLKQNNEEG
ncbi:hypothetical protein [Ethanoligenens sp.]|uniref:hypothetical protein n=1 Tax=Ethanoligenens sp. TaxID=2099655 RepID=UPI0039EB62B1